MSTVAIKDTAFASYLRELPRDKAIAHLWHCLSESPTKDNMTWELWESVHGDKRYPSSEIEAALGDMLDSLGLPK